MGAVASVDDVEDGLARVLVHHAGEDDELDGVQDDRAVRLARRFAVQPGAFGGREKEIGQRLIAAYLAKLSPPT